MKTPLYCKIIDVVLTAKCLHYFIKTAAKSAKVLSGSSL